MNAKECSYTKKTFNRHATFYWLFRNNKNYYLIEPQSVAWANKLKSVHKAVYVVPVACVFNLIIIKNGI